jgi:hypothetical protein
MIEKINFDPEIGVGIISFSPSSFITKLFSSKFIPEVYEQTQ